LPASEQPARLFRACIFQSIFYGLNWHNVPFVVQFSGKAGWYSSAELFKNWFPVFHGLPVNINPTTFPHGL